MCIYFYKRDVDHAEKISSRFQPNNIRPVKATRSVYRLEWNRGTVVPLLCNKQRYIAVSPRKKLENLQSSSASAQTPAETREGVRVIDTRPFRNAFPNILRDNGTSVTRVTVSRINKKRGKRSLGFCPPREGKHAEKNTNKNIISLAATFFIHTVSQYRVLVFPLLRFSRSGVCSSEIIYHTEARTNMM